MMGSVLPGSYLAVPPLPVQHPENIPTRKGGGKTTCPVRAAGMTYQTACLTTSWYMAQEHKALADIA